MHVPQATGSTIKIKDRSKENYAIERELSAVGEMNDASKIAFSDKSIFMYTTTERWNYKHCIKMFAELFEKVHD